MNFHEVSRDKRRFCSEAMTPMAFLGPNMTLCASWNSRRGLSGSVYGVLFPGSKETHPGTGHTHTADMSLYIRLLCPGPCSVSTSRVGLV